MRPLLTIAVDCFSRKYIDLYKYINRNTHFLDLSFNFTPTYRNNEKQNL